MSSSNGFEDSTFDLPRWQPQQSYLANSPAAAQYSSMYGPPARTSPQPHALDDSSLSSHVPGPQRLPPLNMINVNSSQQQLPSAPARQQQQTRPDHLSPSQPSLSRSYSIGASNTLGNRNRRPVDDIEGAYSSDMSSHPSVVQQPAKPSQQASFYPPSITYATSGHQQYPPSSGMSPSMMQQDQYMPDVSYEPTRRQTAQHSPRESQSSASRKSDSYGGPPMSAMYTGTAPYSSPYGNTAPIQPTGESTSKPSTPYLGPHQQTLPSTSQYSPSTYTQSIETQQTPSRRHHQTASQGHLGHHLSPQQSSFSIPNISHSSSPVAYQAAQQPRANEDYYSPPIKDEPMQDVLPVNRPGSASQLGYDLYGAVQGASRQPSPLGQLTPRKRRLQGFRPVRDLRDLRPSINHQPPGRRADPSKPGTFLNPLMCLTTHIASTYSLCNHTFRYESSHNPRRVLTKPSKPVHNEGFDNEDYDYILYVNDWLGPDNGNKYIILDILGQGTFGQVVKCQNMKTHEIVAVKVVKNKPAYFNQSMMEVTILEMLNKQHDPKDEHHILRMLDSFVHKNHLCLVFELLSQNLYELIKQNQFQGLSTQLVKVFTAQLLDALCVLKEAHLIHCDLKPENILLKSLSSPAIKVIDFGSACHERQTVYTYIQSRFYRSPEVLLGLNYNSAIDMWSLGCIAVELFLGLPLFPGSSEYNQITRIVEMLGLPPPHMLEHGKQTGQFFDSYQDAYNQKQYKLKSIEQYSREHNTQEQPGKQYFKATTLPEIVELAPMPASRHSSSGKLTKPEIEKEQNNRAAFVDFCMGLLNMNPMERWTPHQARRHPFITGEKFVKKWQPYASITEISAPSPALVPPSSDPRRPYGGLVPAQSKGSRAYPDAAAYNQQLNQHQTYTAQQQAAQASNQAYRNPYVAPPNAQQQQQSNQAYPNRADKGEYGDQSLMQQQQQQVRQQQQQVYAHALHPSGNVSGGATLAPPNEYSNQSTAAAALNNPHPPSNSYFPNARARANTINQVDTVPPALARLTQMNKDLSGIGRNTLTPIINRAEDPLQQWERRAQGKVPPVQSYPQLEYLQQQAEMAGSWQHSGAPPASRYPPPPTNMMQYQTPVQLLMDNQERRRNRASQRTDYNPNLPVPPQTYSGGDANLSGTFVPLQPNQYHVSSNSAQSQPSLYGGSVVPPGQQQTLGQYNQKSSYPVPPPSNNRDSRRSSGVGLENWTHGS